MFTYVVVPTRPAQGALLGSWVQYAVGVGQNFGPALDYAPLPNVVANAAKARAKRL
jgi:hypothetical protein